MFWVLVFIQCSTVQNVCHTSGHRMFKTLESCEEENSKYFIRGTCLKSHARFDAAELEENQ
jgi:hypothetical protein